MWTALRGGGAARRVWGRTGGAVGGDSGGWGRQLCVAAPSNGPSPAPQHPTPQLSLGVSGSGAGGSSAAGPWA